MGVGVGQRTESVVIFLASRIPKGQLDVLAVNLDIGNVVLEDGGDVDLERGLATIQDAQFMCRLYGLGQDVDSAAVVTLCVGAERPREALGRSESTTRTQGSEAQSGGRRVSRETKRPSKRHGGILPRGKCPWRKHCVMVNTLSG